MHVSCADVMRAQIQGRRKRMRGCGGQSVNKNGEVGSGLRRRGYMSHRFYVTK